MEEIVKQLRAFVSEFNINMTPHARYAKCLEENDELRKAIDEHFFAVQLKDSTTQSMLSQSIKEELCDRVITGMLYLMALQVDPVQAVKEKLELTFEKYRAKKSEQG